MGKVGFFEGGTKTGTPINDKTARSVGNGVIRAGAMMGGSVSDVIGTVNGVVQKYRKNLIEEDELADAENHDRGLTLAKAGMQGLRDKFNADGFSGGSREAQAETDEFYAQLERPEFKTERGARAYDNTIQNMRIMSLAEAKSMGEAAVARRYKASARGMVDAATAAGDFFGAMTRIQADEGVAWSPEEAAELKGVVNDAEGWSVLAKMAQEDPWRARSALGEFRGKVSDKQLIKMSKAVDGACKAAGAELENNLGKRLVYGEDIVEDVKTAMNAGKIPALKARSLLGAAARGAAGEEVHDGAVYSGLTSAVGQLQDSGVEADPEGEKAAKIEFAINTAPISKGSKSYLLGELSAWRRGDVGINGERGAVVRKALDVQFDSGAFGTVKDDEGKILPAGFATATSKKLLVEKEVQRLIRAQNTPVEDIPSLTNKAIRTVDQNKNIFGGGGDKGKNVILSPSPKRDRIGVGNLQHRVEPKKNNVDEGGENTNVLGVDISITKMEGESLDKFIERNWGAFGVETMEDAAMLRGELINLYYAG